MRAQDVLNHQVEWEPPITDAEIAAWCEQCGASRSLGECLLSDAAEQTVYRCPSCPETLLIVVNFVEGTPPMAGRGYRLGPWVLRNPVELTFRGIKIPASWNATLQK